MCAEVLLDHILSSRPQHRMHEERQAIWYGGDAHAAPGGRNEFRAWDSNPKSR